MKRKNDKLKKPNIKQAEASFDQVQGQNKVQSEHHDEAYRQINIVSFNKNFVTAQVPTDSHFVIYQFENFILFCSELN